MIRLSDTYVRYASGVEALRGVNLTVTDGEFVFIVGPSGAGKSTLLKLLTAEIRPSAGLALVNSVSISRLKRRHIPRLRRSLGVVYQDFRLIERMSVFENVAFAMRVVGVSDSKKIKKRVMYVLELVGLAEKADRMPAELSGGEQQRVALARALMCRPQLILADEPTGNLDALTGAEILKLLFEVNDEPIACVMVTHSAEAAARCDRTFALDSGRLA